MWDRPRMTWSICWIIIGSLVQTRGFSTTVVKEGEDAILECGLQTKVVEGYLRWQAITNDIPEELASNLRDRIPRCDDRIINCTLYANGSIQLESVGKEDGARYYRCLRGDEDGYNYYSDHRLLVLSKESPSISQSPTSAIAFKASRTGIVHSYGEPACEDDVDGNLPVVCYPPSGIIVDREYETIQCNCTDSDGLMDSVTFSVTSVTHWVHPGWRKAVISLLVISILIILILIWICLNCKNLKKSNTNREHAVSERSTQSESQVMRLKRLQEMLTMNNILEEQHKKISERSTQSESQEMRLEGLQEMLEMHKKMLETMKNILEEQNEKISERSTQSESQVMHRKRLQENLEILETWNNEFEERHKKISEISTQSESQVMRLEGFQEMLEMHKKETWNNEFEEQHKKSMKIAKEMTVKGWRNRDLYKLSEEKQDQKILESSLL